MPFSILFRAASKLDQAKEGVPPFLASIKFLLGKEIPFPIWRPKGFRFFDQPPPAHKWVGYWVATCYLEIHSHWKQEGVIRENQSEERSGRFYPFFFLFTVNQTALDWANITISIPL